MSAGKCLQSIMISQAAKSRCKCRDRSPGCWGCSCWWLGGSYDNTDGEPKMAEAIVYAFKKVTFVHITCMYTYSTHIYVYIYIYTYLYI